MGTPIQRDMRVIGEVLDRLRALRSRRATSGALQRALEALGVFLERFDLRDGLMRKNVKERWMAVLWVEKEVAGALADDARGVHVEEVVVPPGIFQDLLGRPLGRGEGGSSPEEDSPRDLWLELVRVRAPPPFAKALGQEYRKLMAFLARVDLEDAAVRERFVSRRDDLEELVRDMDTANEEALDRTKQPMVFTPSGMYQEILGEAVERAADGEYWPLDQPDGPITWE